MRELVRRSRIIYWVGLNSGTREWSERSDGPTSSNRRKIRVQFKLEKSHRKSLHTAAIRQRFGFLYKPFHRGAEFWEILEVFRKLSLTGLLVFVTDDAYRAVTAVLICVVSVANLNYLRPQAS